MTIDLTPHPAEGHSIEYTVRVAGAISEAVRVLNYASLGENAADGLPYPSTIYDVISRLQAAAAGMDQLVNQLAGRLTQISTEHEITATHGIHAGDPAAALTDALDSLETVRRTASGLEGALAYSLNALSPIGVRIPDDDLEDD